MTGQDLVGHHPQRIDVGLRAESLGLATQLLRVLDDDDLATSLTANGRINVERFAWAATAERLASLYLQLAEGTS